MKRLDLMNEKPEIDIPTLNYIWDRLWRRNKCNNRSNEIKRAIFDEQEQILEMLQVIADEQQTDRPA